MKSKFVTIGLIQSKVGAEMSKNFSHTCDLVIQAAKKGAKIICLQELYNVPYFPQRQKEKKDNYIEYIPGASTSMFEEVAKMYGVVIIVPVYEKYGKPGQKNGWKYFNSVAVINEKGRQMKEVYRKIHIPQDPGFYEKDYFEESKSGYKVYKTKFGTFAVLICYDQWFPEAARAVRLMGADIIFYPTALGDILGYKHPNDFHDGWETVIRGHAVANSLVVASVNRVGIEGRMKFFGQSFIADPWGKVLKRASKDKEQIIVQKVDLAYNKFLSDGWGFMRNRRPDTYKILTDNKLVSKSKKLINIEDYRNEKKALERK